MRSFLLLISVVAMGVLAGCQNSDPVTPPASQVASVQFVYGASTVLDPRVASQFPLCVQEVGRTNFHPGWRNFDRFDMTAVGTTQWVISFSDVPVNQEVQIRINDANACATDPHGASTLNVFANGVRLMRIVQTPGSGAGPGLAFRVASNGTVTP